MTRNVIEADSDRTSSAQTDNAPPNPLGDPARMVAFRTQRAPHFDEHVLGRPQSHDQAPPTAVDLEEDEGLSSERCNWCG